MKSMKFEDIADEEHYSRTWISTIHSTGLKKVQEILNTVH